MFVEKVGHIVGLYLNPPERAVVPCVEEKTQVQALDRSQPYLPLRPGQPVRHSHDYERHGTKSLFALLDVQAVRRSGPCMPRNRTAQFRRFPGMVKKQAPDDLDVHFTMDNASTHKTKVIRR